MIPKIDRREMLKVTTATAAGLAMPSIGFGGTVSNDDKPVRVGVIGVGNRGGYLTGVLLSLKSVLIPAICDIDTAKLNKALDKVEKAGQPRPEGYSQGEEAFRSLVARDDLDAVVIATPWEWHTPMAVATMKAGKYAAVEVPAAIDMQQCWDLVNTHEATGIPCMMLENWSFRRDNLAVLNMVRKGLFGEMVHCHCAHCHDCIDHFFFGTDGRDRWPGKYLIETNRDQYPTHSLGPVISWLDINCGDAYAYLTATATSSKSINAYFARRFGPDHPGAKRKYAQGDIVTSVIKTHRGRTIVINYDMQLPRPYDNQWMVQGTLGVYNEQGSLIYLTGRSPKYHQWEPFAPYQEEFDHTWWKTLSKDAEASGHGGTDYLELQEFLRAVRNKTQTPIDVYDSVVMSVIIPLSEASIAKGSAPVPCPDFTRGKWKTKKPTFALDT